MIENRDSDTNSKNKTIKSNNDKKVSYSPQNPKNLTEKISCTI